jgi:CRISPR/Cas system endoribonuclease Cas6 (RAMP superfamily)
MMILSVSRHRRKLPPQNQSTGHPPAANTLAQRLVDSTEQNLSKITERQVQGARGRQETRKKETGKKETGRNACPTAT